MSAVFLAKVEIKERGEDAKNKAIDVIGDSKGMKRLVGVQ